MSRPQPNEPLRRARELRKNLTDTERLLWSKLRNRRFARFKFRRQVPIGPYIVDFVCFEQKFVIELDGGQHTLQSGYDTARTRWLEAQGYRVMRFWNHVVFEDDDSVEEAIWIALTGTSPYGTTPSGFDNKA
jgi:adenine-specific DNA-methyltransferase